MTYYCGTNRIFKDSGNDYTEQLPPMNGTDAEVTHPMTAQQNKLLW